MSPKILNSLCCPLFKRLFILFMGFLSLKIKLPTFVGSSKKRIPEKLLLLLY